jgi:rRNA maturation endonuclease Nob1
VVRCESCGAEVREDWRLCPFCGDSSEPRIGQNAIRGQREVEV